MVPPLVNPSREKMTENLKSKKYERIQSTKKINYETMLKLMLFDVAVKENLETQFSGKNAFFILHIMT